ncbi:hypothetical protein K0M31_003647 [Melipona bicolor]|uniref:Uncharacterized protein n=1 Tax=Melipona bicolor TaxID=60889 RepID=A0AA40FZX5_9HYME|nr:hypothetical protein K0M31_003647 [Melipona bicolor]
MALGRYTFADTVLLRDSGGVAGKARGAGWAKKEKQGGSVSRQGASGHGEQQVVDAKRRSTDVKSWGNKKVTLIPD